MLARKLSIAENIVEREFKSGSRRMQSYKQTEPEPVSQVKGKPTITLQEKILVAMLSDTDIYNRVKQRIGIKFFAGPDYRALISSYDQLPGNAANKMEEMRHQAALWGVEEAWARIVVLLEEEHPDYSREVEEFILRVEQKKIEQPWQRAFEQIQSLSVEGDFETVLTFILKLNKLGIRTREGGVR